MKTKLLRPLLLGIVALPLALSLAACDKSKDTAATTPSGEPIAKIAPPAGKSWSEVIQQTPEGGYRMGNPDAPLKLLEFGALSCSHCADFSEKSSAELRDQFVDSGRVSYELRLFMLNALDMPAALLVTCGAPETVPALAEQFWAWQPTMFENLQAAGDARMQAISNLPPPQQFASVAQVTQMDAFVNARGIAADQAKACLADSAKATKLAEQTQAAGKEYNITGTPTFVLNGEKLDMNTWPELKARLETMGAR